MNGSRELMVWDPLVRFFHWSLVIFFTVAYLSGDDESDLHIVSGYIVTGLVLFRLLWGFIGTRYARFSNFVTGPGKVVGYLGSVLSGRPKPYAGHNPAGGYMILALLAGLTLTCYSGLAEYGNDGQGPLAGNSLPITQPAYADEDEGDEALEARESGEKDEFWEEVHEVAANLTLVLVFTHILGVLVTSWLHRENLVRAMITGRKVSREPRPSPDPH